MNNKLYENIILHIANGVKSSLNEAKDPIAYKFSRDVLEPAVINALTKKLPRIYTAYPVSNIVDYTCKIDILLLKLDETNKTLSIEGANVKYRKKGNTNFSIHVGDLNSPYATYFIFVNEALSDKNPSLSEVKTLQIINSKYVKEHAIAYKEGNEVKYYLIDAELVKTLGRKFSI